MNEIFPFLFETDGECQSPLSNKFETRAFLLVRSEGNLLVYRSGKIESHADFIRAKGGVKKQYLSHNHEAGAVCDRVRELFGAPLACPEPEKELVSEQCQVDETFEEDGELEPGFQLIMTPGHTAGSSCFLWRSPEGNILFTGDILTPDEKGVWRAFLLRKSRAVRDQVIHSLGKIRNLEVDLLVPSGSENGRSHQEVTQQRWSDNVGDCIERLETHGPRLGYV